jgi:putative hemolysin
MLVVLVEVLVIAALILANGALAGSEIALVSAGKGRLQSRAKAGDRRAAVALELTESPNRFLSAIQIGITLVGITAGAVGATALAGSLSAVLVGVGMPPGRATVLGIVVVIGAITFLTLVVGELVPKRLALGDPEGVAVRVARPMTALARFATPVVHLLSASTDLVLRLLPWKLTLQPTVTEEDIERLVAEATASGILEKTEQDVVRRLFRLSDQTVETLMTPRERIVWLDTSASQSERRLGMTGAGHSRFIVCDGELDRVRGYVKVQDLLDLCVRGEEPDPRSALRRPHVVSPWTPAFRILEQFQRSGDHIAIVQSTAGRVIGLVTLNDVLKNIVGTFPEPHEMAPPEAVRRPDGSWLVDGLLPFEDALGRIGRDRSAAEGFPTLHAFVVHHLGEDPSAADRFEWEGLGFEVVDMDGSRVDKVLVERLEPGTDIP